MWCLHVPFLIKEPSKYKSIQDILHLHRSVTFLVRDIVSERLK